MTTQFRIRVRRETPATMEVEMCTHCGDLLDPVDGAPVSVEPPSGIVSRFHRPCFELYLTGLLMFRRDILNAGRSARRH
jgi:hypothetical protein